MAGIICAIRGGPDSRPTIDKAIALSRKTGLAVYFLYVVNLDFLANTTRVRWRTISAEMEQMGEFILLTARSQAEAAGVPAQGVVRHGNVSDEIIRLSQEENADYVILGRPRGKPDKDVFTHDLLSQLQQRIERESNAKVAFTEGDTA